MRCQSHQNHHQQQRFANVKTTSTNNQPTSPRSTSICLLNNRNATQEDLLIHGDSVYDIIDKQDHAAIQAELNRNVPPQPGHSQHASAASAAAAAAAAITSLEGEHRMFLCRMNVSRNARRQMRFGDQKVSGEGRKGLLCIEVWKMYTKKNSKALISAWKKKVE